MTQGNDACGMEEALALPKDWVYSHGNPQVQSEGQGQHAPVIMEKHKSSTCLQAPFNINWANMC